MKKNLLIRYILPLARSPNHCTVIKYIYNSGLLCYLYFWAKNVATNTFIKKKLFMYLSIILLQYSTVKREALWPQSRRIYIQYLMQSIYSTFFSFFGKRLFSLQFDCFDVDNKFSPSSLFLILVQYKELEGRAENFIYVDGTQ